MGVRERGIDKGIVRWSAIVVIGHVGRLGLRLGVGCQLACGEDGPWRGWNGSYPMGSITLEREGKREGGGRY